MDIGIKSEKGRFKFRASGLLWKNKKLLISRNGREGFYSLPGGHVELHESTYDAVIREMQEESGAEVEVVSILAVVENFFFSAERNMKHHEINYYYNVKLKNDNALPVEDFVDENNSDGRIEFRWVSLEELKNIDFRPAIIKNKLLEKDSEFNLLIVNQGKNEIKKLA